MLTPGERGSRTAEGSTLVGASLQQELHLILAPGENPVTPIVQCFALEGDLDPDVLAEALSAMCHRHEALRMRFPRELRPRTALLDDSERTSWPLDIHDLSELTEKEQQARLADLVRRLQTSIDLAEGPLFGALLARRGEGKWFFAFVVDHIVFDGMSLDLFWADLSVVYAARRGVVVSDHEPAPSYLAWAAEQHEHLCRADHSTEVAHWIEQFNARGRLLPPLDVRPSYLPAQRGAGAVLTDERTVPREWRQAALTAPGRHRTTEFSAVLGAALLAMRRVSTTDQVGFRIATWGRSLPCAEGVVGLLAPSMPFFFDARDDAVISDVLGRLRTRLPELIDNELPLTSLRAHAREVAGVRVDDDRALRAALHVPHAVLVADSPEEPAPDLRGVACRPVELPERRAVSASPLLKIRTFEDRGDLRVTLTASTGVYTPALFRDLLDAFVEQFARLAEEGTPTL
ncbi:condensation domain-containing protein [Streptomyces sp. NPDC006967]|uniref:condensation domain-containing protein n=1 Tax=Streptomyces sp. NPDC006967 TaxID=3156906 RepID=UPI0033E97221